MIKDEELAGHIKTELLNDLRLSLHPIEVQVTNGIVSLCGCVQSYRRKLAAQEIAASYEGVRDVVNHLKVEPPVELTDQEIADNVRALLDASTEITKQTVTVTACIGVVTLSGNVGSHWEYAMAEDLARSARGVRDIENLTTLNLQDKVADEELAYAIEAGLERTRGLQEARIAIAVSHDQIVLSGSVDQLWQKETAESRARRFGHFRIRNEIRVEGN